MEGKTREWNNIGWLRNLYSIILKVSKESAKTVSCMAQQLCLNDGNKRQIIWLKICSRVVIHRRLSHILFRYQISNSESYQSLLGKCLTNGRNSRRHYHIRKNKSSDNSFIVCTIYFVIHITLHKLDNIYIVTYIINMYHFRTYILWNIFCNMCHVKCIM